MASAESPESAIWMKAVNRGLTNSAVFWFVKLNSQGYNRTTLARGDITSCHHLCVSKAHQTETNVLIKSTESVFISSKQFMAHFEKK